MLSTDLLAFLFPMFWFVEGLLLFAFAFNNLRHLQRTAFAVLGAFLPKTSGWCFLSNNHWGWSPQTPDPLPWLETTQGQLVLQNISAGIGWSYLPFWHLGSDYLLTLTFLASPTTLMVFSKAFPYKSFAYRSSSQHLLLGTWLKDI